MVSDTGAAAGVRARDVTPWLCRLPVALGKVETTVTVVPATTPATTAQQSQTQAPPR